MLKQNKNNSQIIEDDIIDLMSLTKKVWTARKLVLKSVCVSFIFGIVIAIVSPVVYISETTFVTQTSDQSSANRTNNIGSLAAMAGINLNSETGSAIDKYVNPLLYSIIIKSDEFSKSLINEKLYFLNGDEITLKEYISESNGINLLAFIKRYTIDLIKGDKNEVVSEQFLIDNNFIAAEDYRTIQQLKYKFSIELSQEEGYIKLTARDKNAFISSQILKLITKNLQSRIISLRTNKIKEELEYSKKQYNLKKEEFETLQNKLAVFKDSNKNISTAVFLSELQKLESEYRLQENILTSLASTYNSNKIKLNKDTPIFSVLDEISVPNKRAEPNRKLILFIYTLLGVILSIGYVLGKEPVNKIIQKLKEK